MHLLTVATSVEESERAAKVAVLPVGSFEQHGNHLPLATDTIVACVIAQKIANQYSLLLLPPITISCSHEHEGFAGTVSITARTLIDTISDIRESLARTGVNRLVMVNGHGGNYVLSNIAQEANVRETCLALFPSRKDIDRARARAGMLTTASDDMHGGEWETSILLHSFPDLVGESYAHNDHDAPDRPHLLMLGMREYTDNGIIGKPSLATAEKGAAALESLAETFNDSLKLMTA
ncbi:creatininase family protein [Allokutzneria sp. A3M-2-11 16]|uniref:creatininase family protein n=1 Tax=Allokutzneria sp. A3M-2-11 16 TaxID=2962043 RepID=UPI0020B748F5|nr:creatininase family protein [Allokutzneria sp. A3M-2-11 16]MCP3803886.1 creatininase family protein [Allokutzneria sp. A3M-2-11 16]